MKLRALLFVALPMVAVAQQNAPHATYVYPAGGRQGSSFEITVCGQFLEGSSQAVFAGSGVHAQVKEIQRPLNGKDLQALRDELETLEALHRDPPKANPAPAMPATKPGESAAAAMTTTAKDAPAASGKDAMAMGSQSTEKSFAPPTIFPAPPVQTVKETVPIKQPWTAEERKRADELRAKIRKTEQRRARPALSETVFLQVTIDANAAPGNHELRLLAKDGITNPLVFEVDRLPEFAHPARRVPAQLATGGGLPLAAQARAEALAEPTPVSLPIIVNGQLMPGSADRYRFHATRGQHLVIATETRSLIPFMPDAVPGWFQASMTLRDAKGQELASTDHFRFSQEPVLEEDIPADGEYQIEIRDAIHRGREDFVYRIRIGELPFVTGIFPMGGKVGTKTKVALSGWNLHPASETLPADSVPGIHPLATKNVWTANPLFYATSTLPEVVQKDLTPNFAHARRIAMPVVIHGHIAQPGDKNIFRMDVQQSEEIVAEVQARRLGSPLDSVLTIFDAQGKQLATNDDYDDKGSGLLTHQADSLLRFHLPAKGRYYLQIADTEHNGGPEYAYRLRVSHPMPDFELRVLPTSVNLRPGSIQPIQVALIRRDGFEGSVMLHLKDAPAGLEISGGEIPAGAESVRITLQAPPEALTEPLPLRIEGEAQINGHAVVHEGIAADDQMQAFLWRRMVPAEQGMLWIVGNGKHPALWKPFVNRVNLPVGKAATVTMDVPRWMQNHQFHITPEDAPEGISVQSASIVHGALQIRLQASAKAKAGLAGNLLMQAERTAPADPAKNQKPYNPTKLGYLPALPFAITAK